MTDKELIYDFKKGNEESFNKLVSRHQGWVREFIQKSVKNIEDSEDISQEVFVKAYFGLAAFRFESEFTTWIYRVAINQINNHFRKQKLFSWFYRDFEESSAKINEDHINDRGEILMENIRKLPKVQRNVMILRTLQDLPFKDIGNVLTITENSAKVNNHKAKKNLKKQINE